MIPPFSVSQYLHCVTGKVFFLGFDSGFDSGSDQLLFWFWLGSASVLVLSWFCPGAGAVLVRVLSWLGSCHGAGSGSVLQVLSTFSSGSGSVQVMFCL